MGGVYEFVVAGSFGPLLRSMLSDLDIDDRCSETRLRLTNAEDVELFSLLAVILDGDHELERVLVDQQ